MRDLASRRVHSHPPSPVLVGKLCSLHCVVCNCGAAAATRCRFFLQFSSAYHLQPREGGRGREKRESMPVQEESRTKNRSGGGAVGTSPLLPPASITSEKKEKKTK